MDAEQIVRRLAEAVPVALNNREDGICALCRIDDIGPGSQYRDLADPANHEPTCPWRLAKEHLA